MKSKFNDLGLAVLSATREPGRRYTCEDIADFCDVAPQTVRNIEARAMLKVRKALEKEKPDAGELEGT